MSTDVADSPHPHYDPDLGVSWVTVDTEPNHVELFRNGTVRIYEATIPPGATTQYHRHACDTLYVVTAGGRIRSDEPGTQRPGTRPGRSVPLARKLGWLIRRTVGSGTIHMPTGTLLMQPHAARPLVHRVIAHPANPTAVRMLGVELHQTPAHALLPQGRGLKLEYADHHARTYRLHLASGVPPQQLSIPRGAVALVTTGRADILGTPVDAGSARWLNAGEVNIQTTGAASLTALIIVF